jgi:hypothetical protein
MASNLERMRPLAKQIAVLVSDPILGGFIAKALMVLADSQEKPVINKQCLSRIKQQGNKIRWPNLLTQSRKQQQ